MLKNFKGESLPFKKALKLHWDYSDQTCNQLVLDMKYDSYWWTTLKH